MKKNNILVTGGAGYIGSHVTYDLNDAGYNTIIYDDLSLGLLENIDERSKYYKGSTHNTKELEGVFDNHKIDGVIHLAAWKAAGESMVNPEKYSHNNLMGTINLLNTCVKYGVEVFIFSSTAAVYGYPLYLPIDENHPVKPINFYGFTKLQIENILQWYSALKKIRFASLRYFNAAGYDVQGRVSGKEKNPANLFPLVMEVAAGERDEIQIYGNDFNTIDGTGVRDYIHVNDLAIAHVKALEYIGNNNEDLTVNLSTGKGLSVLEIIKAAERICNRKIPYEIVGRRKGDPAESVAISKFANKLLGWVPKHSSLDELISTMWRIYNND